MSSATSRAPPLRSGQPRFQLCGDTRPFGIDDGVDGGITYCAIRCDRVCAQDAIELAANASKEEAEAMARAQPQVVHFLEGLSVRKVIVVPGKIVNIVAG